MSDEPLVLRSPEQFKALGHPVRHRIVNLLRQRPATLRQLSAALEMPKGTVAYHVRVLREAGLARLADARQVRGGTEEYVGLASAGFTFREGDAAGPEFLINAALGELVPARPGQPEHTMLRHVWLSPDQAKGLIVRLRELSADPETGDSNHGAPYGLLVSLFPADIPTLDRDPTAPVS